MLCISFVYINNVNRYTLLLLLLSPAETKLSKAIHPQAAPRIRPPKDSREKGTFPLERDMKEQLGMWAVGAMWIPNSILFYSLCCQQAIVQCHVVSEKSRWKELAKPFPRCKNRDRNTQWLEANQSPSCFGLLLWNGSWLMRVCE